MGSLSGHKANKLGELRSLSAAFRLAYHELNVGYRWYFASVYVLREGRLQTDNVS